MDATSRLGSLDPQTAALGGGTGAPRQSLGGAFIQQALPLLNSYSVPGVELEAEPLEKARPSQNSWLVSGREQKRNMPQVCYIALQHRFLYSIILK